MLWLLGIVGAILVGLAVAVLFHYIKPHLPVQPLHRCRQWLTDRSKARQRKRETPEQREKTVRSVVLCSATTILVFGILSISALPVLHGIGLTVAIGAASALVMASIFCGTKASEPSDSGQE